MALKFRLNIAQATEIKVLEVLSIGLGKEEEKDSVLALYPCTIIWTDPQTPSHLTSIESSLQKTDRVWVSDWSKQHITPGIYTRIQKKGHVLFEKKE